MNGEYDDEKQKDQHRIASLEISHGFRAHDLVGVFASMPADARLVMVTSLDYNRIHMLYFQSSRFKFNPSYRDFGVIKATFSKQENGEMTVDDVEWPLEVEFPALKKGG